MSNAINGFLKETKLLELESRSFVVKERVQSVHMDDVFRWRFRKDHNAVEI